MEERLSMPQRVPVEDVEMDRTSEDARKWMRYYEALEAELATLRAKIACLENEQHNLRRTNSQMAKNFSLLELASKRIVGRLKFRSKQEVSSPKLSYDSASCVPEFPGTSFGSRKSVLSLNPCEALTYEDIANFLDSYKPRSDSTQNFPALKEDLTKKVDGIIDTTKVFDKGLAQGRPIVGKHRSHSSSSSCSSSSSANSTSTGSSDSSSTASDSLKQVTTHNIKRSAKSVKYSNSSQHPACLSTSHTQLADRSRSRSQAKHSLHEAAVKKCQAVSRSLVDRHIGGSRNQPEHRLSRLSERSHERDIHTDWARYSDRKRPLRSRDSNERDLRVASPRLMSVRAKCSSNDNSFPCRPDSHCEDRGRNRGGSYNSRNNAFRSLQPSSGSQKPAHNSGKSQSEASDKSREVIGNGIDACARTDQGRSIRQVTQNSAYGTERRPGSSDVASGPAAFSPEAQLLRICEASVRNAREHHSASITLGVPSRGTRLTEDQKCAQDAHWRAEEVRCNQHLASKLDASPGSFGQSVRNTPPTLFSQRQLARQNSASTTAIDSSVTAPSPGPPDLPHVSSDKQSILEHKSPPRFIETVDPVQFIYDDLPTSAEDAMENKDVESEVEETNMNRPARSGRPKTPDETGDEEAHFANVVDASDEENGGKEITFPDHDRDDILNVDVDEQVIPEPCNDDQTAPHQHVSLGSEHSPQIDILDKCEEEMEEGEEVTDGDEELDEDVSIEGERDRGDSRRSRPREQNTPYTNCHHRNYSTNLGHLNNGGGATDLARRPQHSISRSLRRHHETDNDEDSELSRLQRAWSGGGAHRNSSRAVAKRVRTRSRSPAPRYQVPSDTFADSGDGRRKSVRSPPLMRRRYTSGRGPQTSRFLHSNVVKLKSFSTTRKSPLGLARSRNLLNGHSGKHAATLRSRDGSQQGRKSHHTDVFRRSHFTRR